MWQYYSKGLKESVQNFDRHSTQCPTINLQTPNHVQLHLEIPLIPMDLISIDLTGPFETTTKGNQYALTKKCMFTNYIICIPIPYKSADVVVNAYLKKVYCRFTRNQKIP